MLSLSDNNQTDVIEAFIGKVSSEIYSKRDDFNFEIVNFPFHD